MLITRLFCKKKTTPVLGVAIDKQTVRLLELDCQHGRYAVKRYTAAALAQANDVTAATNTHLQQSSVAAALDDAYRQSGSTLKKAAIALPASTVISKTITAPKMFNDDEMEAYIRLEAAHYIPYSTSEAAIDFVVLGDVNKTEVSVLLIACRQQTVDQHIQMFQPTVMTPTIVDNETHCIERALPLLQSQLGNQNDSNAGDIVIADINVEELLIYRWRAGRIIDTYEYRINDLSLSTQNMVDQTVLTEHLINVLKSLSYYRAIGHIVLLGTMAASDVADHIQQHINISTVVANPFVAMELSATVDRTTLYDHAPMLMVACGLAMRSFV